MVIELDGEVHKTQKEKDDSRTDALREMGFKVIRFRNEEVTDDIERVLNKILDEV